MWKHLLAITSNLLVSQIALADICETARRSLTEQYGDIDNFELSQWREQSYTGGVYITRINAWFDEWEPENGGHGGALTALKFKYEAEDCSVLENDGWVRAFNQEKQISGAPEFYEVPADRTLVKWT